MSNMTNHSRKLVLAESINGLVDSVSSVKLTNSSCMVMINRVRSGFSINKVKRVFTISGNIVSVK